MHERLDITPIYMPPANTPVQSLKLPSTPRTRQELRHEVGWRTTCTKSLAYDHYVRDRYDWSTTGKCSIIHYVNSISNVTWFMCCTPNQDIPWLESNLLSRRCILYFLTI